MVNAMTSSGFYFYKVNIAFTRIISGTFVQNTNQPALPENLFPEIRIFFMKRIIFRN